MARDGFDALTVRGAGSDPGCRFYGTATARGGLSELASPHLSDGRHCGVLGTPLRGDRQRWYLLGPDVPVGDYTLRACVQGYEPHERTVSIDGQTTESPSGRDEVALARQIRLASTGLSASAEYTLRFDEVLLGHGIRLWATWSSSLDFMSFDARVRWPSRSARARASSASPFSRAAKVAALDPLQTVADLDQSGPTLIGAVLSERSPTCQRAMTLSPR